MTKKRPAKRRVVRSELKKIAILGTTPSRMQAPINDTDEVFESQGVTIVCELKSYVVGNMTGTEIDYRDSMMGAGFAFNNPNAKHSCGCGSSYSA